MLERGMAESIRAPPFSFLVLELGAEFNMI
jgi:hypothetical protein